MREREKQRDESREGDTERDRKIGVRNRGKRE